MNWLLLLILAYFFIALTALTDKFILTKALGQPVVYVFFVSVLGLVAVVLIPFGFFIPSLYQIFISFIAGSTFTLALFFLYKSLKRGEASRVFTTTGSLTAVFTFLFSWFFLSELLTKGEIIGFFFLIVGGIFISLNFQIKFNSKKNYLLLALISAVMYAASYTAAKYIYDGQGFISGFVWLRIFAFITGIAFLLNPKNLGFIKQELKKGSPISKKSNQLILIAGQASSAVGFLILNYVISLKNPAIVLAAQGLQYLFLFILTLGITFWLPKILKEKITAPVVLQKSLAIILIIIGLSFLAFS